MLIKRIITSTKGEGIISSMASLVVVIGLLCLFFYFFVLGVNNFQLQTALNLSLKMAQTEGYLSTNNISKTQSYLTRVGIPTSTIESNAMDSSARMDYGSEIEITITASTNPLPAMDDAGHSVPDSSRSVPLTSTGSIVSQYIP
jgi:hypothetical protein